MEKLVTFEKDLRVLAGPKIVKEKENSPPIFTTFFVLARPIIVIVH